MNFFRGRLLRQRLGRLIFAVVAASLPTGAPLRADPPKAAEIERLIEQLGSTQFAIREAASKDLDAFGEPALEGLRNSATQSRDPEIRRRAEALVLAIENRIYFTEVRRLVGHNDYVSSVAFAPDGKQVLSGGADGTVRLWDVESGKEVRRFGSHKGVVHNVAISPDGQRALSGGRDGVMRLWDLAMGKELRRFEGHTYTIWSVAFSPDGRQALSGDGGHDAGNLRLWELATGKELCRLEHKGDVDRAAFSPDCRQMVSASIDPHGTNAILRLWDVESHREIRRFQEGRHQRTTSLAFSPDGCWLLTGSWDRTVRIWDVASGKTLQHFDAGASVYAVAFASGGRRALAAAGGSVYLGGNGPTGKTHGSGTIYVWDTDNGRERRRFPGKSIIICLAVSPDGSHAVSGGHDGMLRLWRLPK